MNLDQVWKILYDRARVQLYGKTAKLQPVDTDLPFGLGPKLNNLVVDFPAAAQAAKLAANNEMATLCYKVSASEFTRASLEAKLRTDLAAMDRAQAAFAAMMADNGRKNAAALQSNLAGWDTAIKVARGTRDFSIVALSVGATVATGGAAVAIAAAGSTLSGVAKVQDSTRKMSTEQAIGTVVATAGLEFTFGQIGGAANAMLKPGWAGKAIVALVTDVPKDTATSLIIGDPGADGKPVGLGAHAWQATQNWATGQAVGGLLRTQAAKSVLHSVAVPVAAALKDGASDKKGAVVAGLIRSYAKKGVKAGGSASIETIGDWYAQPKDKSPLPDKVARQPVYGGAAAADARIAAVFP